MNKKSVPKSPKILQVRQDRGYDCVYAGGRKFMLGKSGSPEAQAVFLKLQIQALTDPTLSMPLTPIQFSLTFNFQLFTTRQRTKAEQ